MKLGDPRKAIDDAMTELETAIPDLTNKPKDRASAYSFYNMTEPSIFDTINQVKKESNL